MPSARQWRRAPARAVGQVVRAPFALAMVSTLLLTTIWTRWHPEAAADLFAWVSTNVHNLSVAPIRSLVLSAFFLPDERWILNATLLLIAIVPLERRIGTLRTMAVFASAHVAVTLVTEGWVVAALSLGRLPRSAAFVEDVGVSYGLYGVAAATCYFVPARFGLRLAAVLGLAGYLAVQFARSPSMSSTGHLMCMTVGLAWWRLLPAAADRLELAG